MINSKTKNPRIKRPTNEINIQCRKQDKSLYVKYYLSDWERKELTQISDAAVLLFEYYLRMASIDNQPITDSGAANYYGWSTSKVKRTRLKLEPRGWYRTSTYKLSDGRKGMSFYIGKDAVSKSRRSTTTGTRMLP
jgi:hypothetical protein